jgi:hypothetical protein
MIYSKNDKLVHIAENILKSLGLSNDLTLTILSRMEAAENCSLAQALREVMQNCDEDDHAMRQYREELNLLGIKLGIFRAYTKEEISKISLFSTSSRRRKKYDFKLDAKYYRFESWEPLEQFGEIYFL